MKNYNIFSCNRYEVMIDSNDVISNEIIIRYGDHRRLLGMIT